MVRPLVSSVINSLSIVIPVFNEQGSLPTLYQELREVMDQLASIKSEVLFIDDGSTDGSVDLLRRFASEDARFKVIIFQRNFGQTAAMSCGIAHATGEVILPMDGDLQNDPHDIPLFLDKIREGYGCVSGWRKERKDAFVHRRLPSWLANRLISWMTGVSLHDYGCSLKAYRREIIQNVSLYGEMHRFIPAYAAWSGAQVAEIVVHHRARSFGVSKYGLSRVFKVMLDLMVVKFLTSYFNRPIHFFGAFGFILLAIGSIAELIALTLRIFWDLHLVQTPLPTVGALFVIVGVQLVLFGLMAEIQMRTFYESNHSSPFTIRERINLDEK